MFITHIYLYFTKYKLYLLGIILNWILDCEGLAARRQRRKKNSTQKWSLPHATWARLAIP